MLTGPGSRRCTILNRSAWPGCVGSGKPVVYLLMSLKLLTSMLSCFLGDSSITLYSWSAALRFSKSQTTAGSESVGMMPTCGIAQQQLANCSSRCSVAHTKSALACTGIHDWLPRDRNGYGGVTCCALGMFYVCIDLQGMWSRLQPEVHNRSLSRGSLSVHWKHSLQAQLFRHQHQKYGLCIAFYMARIPVVAAADCKCVLYMEMPAVLTDCQLNDSAN